MNKIFLVSCASTKLKSKARAEDIYVSPLFVKAKTYARLNADRWFILSAKYGLLDPQRHIEPYDKTLLLMPKAERINWSRKVVRALQKVASQGDSITILAGEAYRQYLVAELKNLGFSVHVPVAGLSIGKQLQWYNSQLAEQRRRDDLEVFYGLLYKLEKGLGGTRLLGSCSGKMCWPSKGVYFFFEEGEYRANSPTVRRVVRVGTHAVSRGAISTLWGRLRSHRGSPDGAGNHRGSIFRLHVGAALLKRENISDKAPRWGVGQAADKATKHSEEWVEKQVSAYLGEKMSLLWLDIGDEPSALSDRAFIERNAIALLSNSRHPADPPSPSWLGRHSVKKEIRESGLWNIRHIDDPYDPRFIDVLSEYVEVTLGVREHPPKSIAPSRHSKRRAGDRHPSKQLNLFGR
jgi:hypothetical protein